MVYTLADGTNFTRRSKIVVTGNSSGAQTDFQIKLTALWAAAMQPDFDDARFTKADMQTLIDAWLESKVDSTSADIWVEFPNTPANTVEQDYYMYYGNGSVAEYWDIGATFLLGDDFSDGNYSSNPTWTVADGTWDAANNKLELNTLDTYSNISVASSNAYGVFEYKVKLDATTTNALAFIYPIAPSLTTGYRITMRGDGLLRLDRIVPATTTIITSSWTADTSEHEIRLERGSDNVFRLYLDDVLKGTSSADYTFTTSTYWRNQMMSDVTPSYVDDVRIRKYASGPPTYAFGSEEHQRRTPMMM